MLGFRDEGLGCSELRVESALCRKASFTGVDPNGFTRLLLYCPLNARLDLECS